MIHEYYTSKYIATFLTAIRLFCVFYCTSAVFVLIFYEANIVGTRVTEVEVLTYVQIVLRSIHQLAW